MRICVVGAGSLGSVIGGVLARAGNDVTLVSRNREHVDAIRAGGLRLDDGHSMEIVDVRAATTYVEVAPVDLAIVLVKSFDTVDAIRPARPVITENTTVMSLQNGVGCEAMLAGVVGADRVVAGRTFVGGRITAPGTVEYGIVGRRTVIGELDGARSARIERIAVAFEAAGLAVDVTDDVVAMIWDKLLVNVSTGAWSALTGLAYGELSNDPDVAAMAIETVAEAMRVASALGISVTTTEPSVAWRRAWEGLPDGFRASMLQSIDRGSRTEVDVIHGAVSLAGRECGVATPINDTLWAAVRGIEHRLRHDARGQADAPTA